MPHSLDRFRLLSLVAQSLSSGGDYESATRAAVAHLVPAVADWVTASVVDEEGVFRRIAVVHADPAKKPWVEKYERDFPPGDHREPAFARVMRDGHTIYLEEVGRAGVDAGVQSEGHREILEGLGLHSCIVVPIRGRSVVGALSLMTSSPARKLLPGDVPFAEDVARILALGVEGATLVRREQRAREKADRAVARLVFLADASARLSETLDPEETLEDLAHLVLPTWADWCLVDLAREDGSLERVIAVSADAGKAHVAEGLKRKYAALPEAGVGISAAMRGNGHVARDVDEAVLRRIARDESHLAALREMSIRSFASAPIVGHEGPLGVLSLVSSTRNYADDELAFVEELGRRAGAALENARLFQATRAATDAAREADRRKDEFLAVLGHELRNPLAPMVSALELLRLRGVERREHDVLRRQVRHMSRLVDDLLDVSRITRGKVSLRKEPLEIATVVAKALEFVEPMATTSRHAIDVHVPAGLVVEADETRLVQVVANLLTNAAKFTPDDGRISVRAERHAGEIVLDVVDDGIGVSPEVLPRMFDMFVQGSRPVGTSGLGLGLTIVRSIVELHGGRVEAHSDGPGKGTRMRVILPGSSAVRLESRAPIATPTGAGLHGMSILVVDDNEDAASMLAEALATEGARTEAVFDAVAALDAIERAAPDAAILDISMPGMDGYELAKKLRERCGDRLRLFAATGYGQEADRDRAREAGFDAHFPKPVELDDIVAELRKDPRRKPRARR